MSIRICRTRTALLFLGLLAAFIAATLGATVAVAQETLPKSRTFHQVSGPYKITVDMTPAEPTFGAAHFDVTLLAVDTSEPVTRAQVRILTTGPAPSEEGWAVAFPSGRQPGVYSADVNLERSGLWTFAVDVEGDAGAGFMSFPVDVPEGSRTNAGLAIFALVLAFFAFGAWRMWLEARRVRRRRREEGLPSLARLSA